MDNFYEIERIIVTSEILRDIVFINNLLIVYVLFIINFYFKHRHIFVIYTDQRIEHMMTYIRYLCIYLSYVIYTRGNRSISAWSEYWSLIATDNLFEIDLTSFPMHQLTRERAASIRTHTRHRMQSQSSRQSGIIINDLSVWEAAPETIPRTGGSQSSTRFRLRDDPRASACARSRALRGLWSRPGPRRRRRKRREEGGRERGECAGLINISNTGGGRN